MKSVQLLLFAVACALAPAFAGSHGVARSQDMVMNSASTAKSDSGPKFSGGVSGILLGTRESPAIHDRTLTEGYLSQPMLMGMATFPRYDLEISGTLNLEGLTLKRGELNAGMSGEGYIDRRHPHTYLHELVATWKKSIGASTEVSATAGKGFAPFGTDDPMMRPFVKYPVNHHLAQIPERAIAIAAASYGPIAVELSRFNGDEPEGPSDFPNSSRLFDSWAGRATARIRDIAEFQGSFANVISPEIAAGGGLTQKKWSASGRYESEMFYGLAEYAHTREVESGRDAFAFRSMLAEGSVSRNRFELAARLEQTDRAEEERLANQFRTPRPASDLSILGRTRWTIATVNASRSFSVAKAQLAPFIEVGRAHAASIDRLAVFDPKSFYGSDVMWSVSAGVRFGFGMMMNRMGRYGAALPKASMKMDDMAGMDMGQ
ncbi:MAG TPA: hypothetical protein VFC35_09795 [Gemmatimonadaceae bacterium]|nr:hypothetical protein [Gemmatimonadaceae bacterium]